MKNVKLWLKNTRKLNKKFFLPRCPNKLANNFRMTRIVLLKSQSKTQWPNLTWNHHIKVSSVQTVWQSSSSSQPVQTRLRDSNHSYSESALRQIMRVLANFQMLDNLMDSEAAKTDLEARTASSWITMQSKWRHAPKEDLNCTVRRRMRTLLTSRTLEQRSRLVTIRPKRSLRFYIKWKNRVKLVSTSLTPNQ